MIRAHGSGSGDVRVTHSLRLDAPHNQAAQLNDDLVCQAIDRDMFHDGFTLRFVGERIESELRRFRETVLARPLKDSSHGRKP